MSLICFITKLLGQSARISNRFTPIKIKIKINKIIWSPAVGFRLAYFSVDWDVKVVWGLGYKLCSASPPIAVTTQPRHTALLLLICSGMEGYVNSEDSSNPFQSYNLLLVRLVVNGRAQQSRLNKHNNWMHSVRLISDAGDELRMNPDRSHWCRWRKAEQVVLRSCDVCSGGRRRIFNIFEKYTFNSNKNVLTHSGRMGE